MNNKKVKQLLSMNIQKFAESGDAGMQNSAADNGGAESSNEGTSSDDLIARIAELEAENAKQQAEASKWKSANDKSSAEAANYKRQLTARMSAQEQADEAKKEAEQAQEQLLADMKKEIENLRTEKLLSERKAFFMGAEVGMDEAVASEIAEAQVKGDWAKFDSALKKHISSVKESTRIAALGERGAVNAGHGADDDDKALAYAKARFGDSKGKQQHNTADILKNFM